MGVKVIKKKRLFEADEQQQQQPAQNNQQQQTQQQPADNQQNQDQINPQDILTKIANLQVASVQALQTTYQKFATDIPEIGKAANDTKSPFNKEAKDLMQVVDNFTKGKADATKPETITAAMQAYGNIAEKIQAFVSKLTEGNNNQQNNNQQQQPAQQNNQQQQPVQNNQQPVQQNNNQQQQQPAPQQQAPQNNQQQPVQNNQQQQPQPTQESRRVSTFGVTLNEKLRSANFNKMLNSIQL